MYYIWSLIIAVVLFVIIQYKEYHTYKNNNQQYNLYTLTNFMTFVIIYIVSTILFYFLLENNNIKKQKISGGSSETTYIDYVNPNVLKKIQDNMYTGFTPYSDE